MKRVVAVLAFLVSVAGSALGAEQTAASRTLARLNSLAGEWEGTLEWSGARTGTGTVRAVYRQTGSGSAIVEDLIMGNDAVPSMTSVYHLDGADLRMTHYCGAHNQPRLKATRIDEEQGAVQFSFVDATNLSEQPAHVEGLEIRFLAADRLSLRFTFTGGGKQSFEQIDLKRTRRDPSAKA